MYPKLPALRIKFNTGESETLKVTGFLFRIGKKTYRIIRKNKINRIIRKETRNFARKIRNN